MSFPDSVRDRVLVACGRHCCLCHKFCGIKIELHHLVHKAEGGEDSFENCIPLCFDCHADMRSYDHKHPKGTKYSPTELRRHRDNWYSKVSASPGASYDDKSLLLDRATFLAIVKLIPYSSLIRFLEQHDFGAPFSPDVFSDMDRIVNVSDDPALEFVDADLEGMRAKLVDDLNNFAHYLASHTWRTPYGRQSVPPEWESQQPERLREVVIRLNAMSSAIAAGYRILFREARKRLGIDPSNDKNPVGMS